MKCYYVYLIRNGLTEANLDGRYIGHTDVLLSDEGLEQLRQLASDRTYPAADAVFSSPLLRCTQTASVLYPGNTAIIINDLVEYNFGEFEGKTAEELAVHPVFPKWLAGEKDVNPPFGESTADFSARICRCFSMIIQGLLKTGTTRAAVITHGGVIMSLLEAFGLPEMPMHRWLTPSGCGYTVRITPSIWTRGRKFEIVAEIPEFPEEIP